MSAGRLSLILVAAAALVMLATPAVAAHAQFYKSDPPPGSRLDAPPAAVRVTLSERVDPSGSGLEVFDGENRRADYGPTRIENGDQPLFEARLHDDVGPGVYRVKWKALSTVDGHITTGTFGFAIGSFEPPAATASQEAVELWSATSRWLAYVGFALAMGAAAYARFVEPRPLALERSRAFARVAAAGLLLVCAGGAGLFVDTWLKSGFGLRTFAGTDVGLRLAFRTLLAASAGLATLFLLKQARFRPALTIAVAATAIVAALTSMFVHSANQGLIPVFVDYIHLISVSVWLGGLGFFLAFLQRAGRTQPFAAIRAQGLRFSRLALTSVILLGLTGLASTLFILGWQIAMRPVILVQSPYGSALAGKIVLFAAMVAVAGLNRFVFLGRRPGRDGTPPGRDAPITMPQLGPGNLVRARPFQRVVAFEAALGVSVLALAGLLTASSPPIEPTAPGQDFQSMGENEDFKVTLTANPQPRVGETSKITLRIEDKAKGEPLMDAIRVRARFLEPGGNEGGGLDYGANHTDGGVWDLGMVFFAEPGMHRVQVLVQTESVYRSTIELDLEVVENQEEGDA